MILSAMPMRARDADEDDGLPCPGRAAPLTRGAFSLMTYTSGSRRRWQPLLLPLQPAILRAHNTSVGAPLAGMNDLNLGIHLHKHTKQPTLLKTSLSCSVNYFVINHNLARSPDARRARRESMTPCMQAVIIPYSRDSFIRNEYSTHQTSSAANPRFSMRASVINLPVHDEPYSDCRLPMT